MSSKFPTSSSSLKNQFFQGFFISATAYSHDMLRFKPGLVKNSNNSHSNRVVGVKLWEPIKIFLFLAINTLRQPCYGTTTNRTSCFFNFWKHSVLRSFGVLQKTSLSWICSMPLAWKSMFASPNWESLLLSKPVGCFVIPASQSKSYASHAVFAKGTFSVFALQHKNICNTLPISSIVLGSFFFFQILIKNSSGWTCRFFAF